MNTFKSIWAVFAGLLVNVILSTATDFTLASLDIFPPIAGKVPFDTWMLGVALSYRLMYTVLGGYATAWLAPQNSMKHVWILGGIGLVLSSIGVAVAWNDPQRWYPIALVVAAIPFTWLGGKWKNRNT